jgi:hypothetical protein
VSVSVCVCVYVCVCVCECRSCRRAHGHLCNNDTYRTSMIPIELCNNDYEYNIYTYITSIIYIYICSYRTM